MDKIPVSPSVFAMITAPHPSPNTLTVERHISRILSTAIMSPRPWAGSPIVCKITRTDTKLPDGTPATPRDAKSATKTTMNWVAKETSMP